MPLTPTGEIGPRDIPDKLRIRLERSTVEKWSPRLDKQVGLIEDREYALQAVSVVGADEAGADCSVPCEIFC